MSRQQFSSRNNIGQVLTFQKSGSTASFNPLVVYNSGSTRVSWRLNNGSETIQIAGNSLSYTGFTSDTNIRTIEMRGNGFGLFNQIALDGRKIYGNLDLSTIPNIGGSLSFGQNSGLTGITHSPSNKVITTYQAFQTSLTGNLDLSPLSGLGGIVQINANPYLTGVTNPNSSQTIFGYFVNQCNLTGNLDLTPLSGLGGSLWVHQNPPLTGLTHSPSSNNFTAYWVYNCNLTGNLDLTPLSGLGGSFQVQNNPLLTNITHTQSSQNFSNYLAYSCNLTGNLDLTPLSGLGGDFRVNNNPFLTGITHSVSLNNFTLYRSNNCGLTGTLDLRNLTKLGSATTGSTSYLRLDGNSSLTNILLPTSTQYFKNENNGLGNRAFSLYGSNLDYINFTTLSGATLVSGTTEGRAGIDLQNNNMITADVNHTLVDFSGNATYNPTGWSNVNLNISGTNGAPDSGSGGYNGIGARDFLTGSPYNWTITHT